MKKAILIFTFVFVIGQTSITAMAHGNGSHGCHRSADTAYDQCNVEGCNITETHEHDGVCYHGHTIGDGHDYHEACTVEGCTEKTEHEHDGTICMPHTNGSGSRTKHHSRRHH